MTIELYDVDAYIQLFDPNLIRLQTVLQCDVKSLSCYWKSLRESGTGPDIPRHNSHLYLQTCFFFFLKPKKSSLPSSYFSSYLQSHRGCYFLRWSRRHHEFIRLHSCFSSGRLVCHEQFISIFYWIDLIGFHLTCE